MPKTYLETNTVHHNFETNGYDNILKELERNGDDEGRDLLNAYPDSFPFLYAVKNRHPDDDVTFSFREIPAREREIIPESQDIRSPETALELQCDMAGAGKFGISVEPYDRAAEDEPQLRARIDFSRQTIDNLNAERMKRILEFCEQHGLSVWEIEFPYKDGVIDVDEKLATLTRDFLHEREEENGKNAGPNPEQEDLNGFQSLGVQVEPLDLNAKPAQGASKAKKEKTLDDIHDEFISFLEKDQHRTRSKTYFERKRRIDGRSTYVFSLYEKPDPDNMKNDGRKDKNGLYVPTYQYRLYVSQDKKTGKFHFGFATPGGKKIDDAMASDLVGIIKKTGATHINFNELTNAEKGVWMIACAENGIIPIGISINVAKAKKMVEAAKNKLTTEDLIVFKRRLAEQMVENAAKKSKDKNDKTLGLSPSEWGYIDSLRSAYDFENFRLAYEDGNGLYAAVIEQIDKGSRDEKEGAATTFGGMQTLRTVFDIYNNYQKQTFGDYINNPPAVGNMLLTPEERRTLVAGIPADKPMTSLTTADFRLIYDTLLPRHIANARKEILTALEREDNRKGPKRASAIVLSNDVFPKVKGALNEINSILTRSKGLDPLTLPTEHKGLEFLRPDPQQPANTNANATPTQTPTQMPAPTNTNRPNTQTR